MTKKKTILLPLFLVAVCAAQNPSIDAPYAPTPILAGGVVMTLYPPGSPFLNKGKVREAEQHNMSQAVPGRINSIVNIHNPSDRKSTRLNSSHSS